MPAEMDFSVLRTRHAAVLFDAYGVLVNASGALPGAIEALTAMRADGQPFLVVTNDASRSPERAAERYRRVGLPVDPAHVLSAGALVVPALQGAGLSGARVVVLGTAESAHWATKAGAIVVAPSVDDPAAAVVLADEGGFDWLDTLDEVVSMVVAAVRAGRPMHLFLANPDLVYPAGDNRFGLTAGALGVMVERALDLLLGADAPQFTVLGKPAAGHFHAALARIGVRDAVMIGDQLRTDVAGAKAAGIASAIVLTGVTTREAAMSAGDAAPDYLLADLCG